jgi:hypothetical protein
MSNFFLSENMGGFSCRCGPNIGEATPRRIGGSHAGMAELQAA